MLGLDFAHILPIILSLLLPVLYVSGSGGLKLSLEKGFATYVPRQLQSDRLHQSPEQVHTQLARGCFDVMMSANPSFNFCELESSCLLDREVPYLEERVNDIVSPKLLYACLHWGAHLERAATTKELCSQLEDFLSTRLLLWMEILNLTNYLDSGIGLLYSVRERLQWLKASAKTIGLVEDAYHFLFVFFISPISQSTPHTYISALQFWSRHGPLMERYGQNVQKLVLSTAEWPARLTQSDATSELAVHLSEASSTTLGANTSQLSSSDGDAEEAGVQPHPGHTRSVWSVAYSPDGAYIASGSADKTIRIQDARTGKPVGQSLIGHTDDVNSVAYSPDGAYIASGSNDKIIRIWDARTGKSEGQPLTGHTDRVFSVAYSPDGAYIVSGSLDETIRIWDAHTGRPVGQSLTGHTDWIRSVAYSPDGAYIASGSDDKTIRI
ncbi:POC1 centriolar protein A [Ceratobasidium sp. 428]|nr:POC1 centriolar protein A [Ceratobasidium sp. 428]